MIVALIKSLFAKREVIDLQHVFAEHPIFLDVRTRSEFVSGAVPGAQNIPLGDLSKTIKRLDKNQLYVVYCRSGNRSAQAILILQSHGFKRLRNGGSRQNVERALQKYKTK